MRGLPEKRRVESENLKNKSPTPTYMKGLPNVAILSKIIVSTYGGDGDAPKAGRFGQGASTLAEV